MSIRVEKNILIFISLLAFGFLVRAVLTPLINTGDILVENEWSQSMYEKGLAGIYFREGWVYSFPTQPPLMMLLFWLSRLFYLKRYFLSLSHNFLRLPPAFLILWFDQNGEFFSLKFWEILADLLNSVLIFFFLKKIFNRQKLAIIGSAIFLFNPVTIFISAIWGQRDLLSAFFVLLAFFIFRGRFGRLVSPVLFSIGILIKPVVVMLLPFYFVFILKDFLECQHKHRKEFLGFVMAGLLASLFISFLFFTPFLDESREAFPYIKEIIIKRIMPSAKGTSKASISAFNLYSAIFTIDNTLGSFRLGFLSLDSLSNGIFVLLNFFVILFWWRWANKNSSRSFRLILFNIVIYLIVEGTFIFKTNMLERYFLPALVSLTILFFLANNRLKMILFCQNLIWFLNLIYAFFWRNNVFIASFFKDNHGLVVRALSLLNLVIFFVAFWLFRKEIRLRLVLERRRK